MGIRILSLFDGGFDLPNVSLYTGNPIALAIGLFVVFDLILFISLAASDSIAKWRVFAGVSAAVALAIPIIVFMYEYSKRSNLSVFRGGATYTKPPPEYFAERSYERPQEKTYERPQERSQERPQERSHEKTYEKPPHVDVDEIASISDLFN